MKRGGRTSAPRWRGSTALTIGDDFPKRGDVWWVRVDKRRPAVVVQTEDLGDSRVRSFLVVPLTSRLHLVGLPGNVRLERASTGLPKPSVANVYDVQKVLREDFEERVSRLSGSSLGEVDAGLRLVLGL